MHIVDDPEETLAIRQWADGGSALPLVSLYAERGELDRAASVARMVLADPDCQDAEAIEAILERASDPPDDWKTLLDEFATEPSLERWKDLMRFVPDDLHYQRHRNSIRYLRKRGVDADVLFQCAADPGLSPDAIELVQDGLVSVETILARGDGSPARATFVGLAAEASFLAGDLLGTIRYLRECVDCQTEWCSPIPHIAFVRQRASDGDKAALDRAGIPPWPEPEGD